jgi:hypothetical protein
MDAQPQRAERWLAVRGVGRVAAVSDPVPIAADQFGLLVAAMLDELLLTCAYLVTCLRGLSERRS